MPNLNYSLESDGFMLISHLGHDHPDANVVSVSDDHGADTILSDAVIVSEIDALLDETLIKNEQPHSKLQSDRVSGSTHMIMGYF